MKQEPTNRGSQLLDLKSDLKNTRSSSNRKTKQS
nr:MAG TPA: hypothetical protein [Bacteriophage sp.]